MPSPHRGIIVHSEMSERKRILIAGGGVAALEAALTLHELAAELVDVHLIAPEPRFWYRPMSVAEPFGLGKAVSLDLADLAERAGAMFTPDALAGVDSERNVARTRAGAELEYDSILLALGVEPHAAVEGALTFRGPADVGRVEELLARIDSGEVRRVVVAVPLGAAWSLPAYELALMLATRGDVEVALATPEDEPLYLFGGAARDAVRELLRDRGIALHSGFFATRFDGSVLHLLPPKSLDADAVIALPMLRGRQIDGIPQTRDGFVVVDDLGRVHGVPDVYAAGDITRFPVKQGGLAAQQADAAAEAIAADAGARIEPRPFRPVLRGLLLTGGEPRFLRRDVALGTVGAATTEPLWWPPAKLVGRRLGPLLAAVTGGVHDAEPASPPGAVPIDVELALTEADAARRRALAAEVPAEEDEPTVGALMSTRFLVVAPEDTLGEVAERMGAEDVGSALVADYGRLIGILTSRDLVRAFAGRIHSSEARVREWMTAEPIVAHPDTSPATAFRLMHDHAIHHLPVVEDGRPVGMVGLRVVARALAERRAHSHIGLGF
jgi:sulfide:quinone oxidoreductase